MDKKTSFFLENCKLVLSAMFWDSYSFMEHKSLKNSLRIQPKIFMNGKISSVVMYKELIEFLTLNYPMQYAKRLSNKIAR